MLTWSRSNTETLTFLIEGATGFFLKGGSNPFQERGAWESTPLHHPAASPRTIAYGELSS